MLLLFLWDQLWLQPRIHAERTTYQPLLALEQEVATLQLASSDTQAAEVAAHAIEVGHLLLPDSKQLLLVLNEFAQTARANNWDAVFHPLPAPAAPPAPDAVMFFATARGKLVPAAGNAQPFASLLVLLEQFSPPNRSIDLTRLSIRADEQGKQTAEVFLRAGCQIAR
jgi:hypothetical protein